MIIKLALALLFLIVTTAVYVRVMWNAIRSTIEQYGETLEGQDQKTLICN